MACTSVRNFLGAAATFVATSRVGQAIGQVAVAGYNSPRAAKAKVVVGLAVLAAGTYFFGRTVARELFTTSKNCGWIRCDRTLLGKGVDVAKYIGSALYNNPVKTGVGVVAGGATLVGARAYRNRV